MPDIRIQQAARRLRTIASSTPGYSPALLNLAGEIEAAADGAAHVPEAAAADLPPKTWALQVSAAVILGERRTVPDPRIN